MLKGSHMVPRHPRRCRTCRGKYLAKRSDQKHCTDRCRDRAKQLRMRRAMAMLRKAESASA